MRLDAVLERSQPQISTSPTARAKSRIFDQLEIQLTPISSQDIIRISDRDRTYRPYITYCMSRGATQIDRAIVLDDIEVGCYRSVIKKEGDGVLGFLGIAPKLQGRGLGTLIKYITSMEAIEAGAQTLHSDEGDETGAVASINQKMGFKPTGEKTHDGCPGWKLEVPDPNIQLAKISALCDRKLKGMSKSDLAFDIPEVDIDNPKRSNMAETVMRRWDEPPYFLDNGGSLLYGYASAPLMMYYGRLRDGNSLLFLRIRLPNLTVERLAQEEEKHFGSLEMEYELYPNNNKPDGFEIVSPRLPDRELRPYSARFANFAQSFF